MLDAGPRLAIGLVLSLVVGLIAYRRGSLSDTGVIGAILVGTSVFGWGGWVWAGTLVAFFVSSSLLSHYKENQKQVAAEKSAKSSRRDLGQTLANGGLAALLALCVGVAGKTSPLYPHLAFAFFGAIGAVNADTWATELGVLAGHPPRLITSARLVPAGTSGGVTIEGTVAALSGALAIGVVAFVLIQGAAIITTGDWLWQDWVLIPVVAASGLIGSLFDSLLGATVQAVYWCPRCLVETERTVHGCGEHTSRIRGWSWLDNDKVNFLASLAGATISASISLLIL